MRDLDRLGVTEIAAFLRATNQGKMTVHSMVFEPAIVRIHIAMGPGPATDSRLTAIDLKELFK